MNNGNSDQPIPEERLFTPGLSGRPWRRHKAHPSWFKPMQLWRTADTMLKLPRPLQALPILGLCSDRRKGFPVWNTHLLSDLEKHEAHMKHTIQPMGRKNTSLLGIGRPGSHHSPSRSHHSETSESTITAPSIHPKLPDAWPACGLCGLCLAPGRCLTGWRGHILALEGWVRAFMVGSCNSPSYVFQMF